MSRCLGCHQALGLVYQGPLFRLLCQLNCQSVSINKLLRARASCSCCPLAMASGYHVLLQNLWGIFLAHLMEVLHSGNTTVRSAAIEALDRSLTGAIASPQLSQQGQTQFPQSTSSRQQSGNGAAAGLGGPAGQPVTSQRTSNAGDTSSSGSGASEDVEHMLLVALESMYKEEREPDVRLGLLRVALHVLQRHGECLTR